MLTGPAGSGKTFRILERFREALRHRDPGVRLLTPTATMAQHLQNEIAREGFVFRPGLIQTLSRFVDPFVADLPQVSEPLLYLIIEAAAHRVARAEFARVVRLPGFCAALARSIEEFSSAGCDAERLARELPNLRGAPLSEAFVAVYREVDPELARRGLATRSQRLLRDAERIAKDGLPGMRSIWLDGFSALPDPELAVLHALCRHAEVTITLPEAPMTAATRDRLVAMGFAEERCAWKGTPPGVELCAAASIEREADEIARRILQHASAGRAFRDMGIVVRTPEVYEPVLRAALDRFGIPARFYFDADVSQHPLVRFLAGTVDAMLSGWEHAATLAAIRLAPGTACDEFDFAVRAQVPNTGLAALRACSGAPQELLRAFGDLDDWRALVLSPTDWAKRLRELDPLLACEPLRSAAIARGQAAALEAFRGAMDEAAHALPDEPAHLSEFWHAAKSVLRLTPLRVADGRRNVVHVLGAHEARQWRLPIVFVCGLVEKRFPRFHTQDPFFPEAARAQLNAAGIRLRRAAGFELEERFLFDWAVTRASESLTLTYPQADARGQQNLPSLYLEGLEAWHVEARAVMPARPAPPAPVASQRIASPDLLQALAERHRTFRPTALEDFLQCPFQFLGRRTLRLEEAPPRPEQRFDFMTQGNIAHEVLAELHRDGRPLEEVFARVFARVCEKEHVPPGYRTEACRARLLADLRALVEDPKWKLGYQVRAEQKFHFMLREDVEIHGRIDRLDVTPDGGAYVIDYKYSGAQNTKDRAGDETRLQPQLYLLAVERSFQLRPIGMSYWGFKGRVEQTAWMPFEPAEAIETTLRIAGEVRAGRVEPHPANPDKCRYCELRDVCRYTTADVEIATGEAAWD